MNAVFNDLIKSTAEIDMAAARNVAIGVLFLAIGLVGFALLKLHEKRKDKNE